MGVRNYLNAATGELTSARRRAELKRYSKEVCYNMEVIMRAISRVKDQIREENHIRERIQKEEEVKAFEKARKAYARAKRLKAKKKSVRCKKERTRKAAA